MKNNKGFSLVEIMIVLVIIGGIMGIILPKIVRGQEESNIRQTKMVMAEIETQIQIYVTDCKQAPEGLDFLVNEIPTCPAWTSSPQNKNLLADAWGTPFEYESNGGRGYNLMSLGKDKRTGGTGPNRDFYSNGSDLMNQPNPNASTQ